MIQLIIIAIVIGVLLAVIHELYLYRKERSIIKKYKDISSFLDDNQKNEEINKMLDEKLNSKNN